MPVERLTFLCKTKAAGMVFGARVPIALKSRSDVAGTRTASGAPGALVARSGLAT